jgi:hypothetical protein
LEVRAVVVYDIRSFPDVAWRERIGAGIGNTARGKATRVIARMTAVY